eukprot:1243115-Prymnesium_polylepis.1
MSIGGYFSWSIHAAVSRAYAADIPVVAAAGNENDDACNYSPASTSEAITVGATTESDAKSHFSNWGACIDIHAPGSSIRAAWPTSNDSTRVASGTSMAAPHVSGVVAQILSLQPTMTAERVGEVVACMARVGAISGLTDRTANLLVTGGDAVANPAN